MLNSFASFAVKSLKPKVNFCIAVIRNHFGKPLTATTESPAPKKAYSH
ncbi:hypothetical protein [Chryseobacterium sp.]